MSDRRLKEEYDCICLTCGNTTKSFVLRGEHGPKSTGKCGKCSNKAYPKTVFREWWAIEALVKEMISLRDRVFDLEYYVEEQVDPLGGER